MGYNLYITRSDEHWDDEPINPITMQEWNQLIAEDPELRLEEKSVDHTPGEAKASSWDRNFAIWTPDSEYQMWFAYDEEYGQIYTKNPDVRTFAKMQQIAKKLSARFHGLPLCTSYSS